MMVDVAFKFLKVVVLEAGSAREDIFIIEFALTLSNFKIK